MKESRSIKVYPEDENNQIEIWGLFGWELKSSQEINYSDTDIDVVGDTIYTTKKSEHYIKLVFERDTEMKNYAQICSLEREYESQKTLYPIKEVKVFSILYFFLFVAGPIGWIIIGVMISKRSKDRKAAKKYNASIPAKNAQAQKRRTEIADEVKALR